MECPYCHKMMEKGVIYVDRGPLKWIEESKDKGVFLSTFQKGIKLTNIFDSNNIKPYYCKDCKKMIIDVEN